MGDNPPPPVIHRKHVRLTGAGTAATTARPQATTNLEELERARKIVTYDARAVANYSEALAGEVTARDWVQSTYKGRAKLRAVMARPGGVPVLDYLFETGNGEFVVVEAKAFESRLGWTKGRILMAGPGGTLYPLELPGTVQQFSPTWFGNRLEEMVGKNGDHASKKLAHELGESWRAGKIRALVIRAPAGAKTTEVALEIIDYSDEWNAHVGAAANHRIPPGTEVGSTVSGAPITKGVSESLPPAERTLAIHKADEKRLVKELERVEDLKTKAESELKRAKGRLQTAEKNQRIAESKKGTWQKTKDAKAAKVAAEKAEVTRLETQAAQPRQEVQDVTDQLREVRQRLTETGAEVRRQKAAARAAASPPSPTSAGAAAAADGRPESTKAARAIDPTTTRPAHGSKPDAPHLDRATKVRGDAAKATDGVADATRARVAAGPRVAEVAVVARQRGLTRVLTLTKKIGKFAVGLFIPLTKLDILLELALWLYDWDRRRRQAGEREWARIYTFLFGSIPAFADPFSNTYMPAIGDSVWSEMNARLCNENHSQNLLYWVREWDQNPKWLGFVYVGIAGNLIRQEHVPRISSAKKAPYPIRYWSSGLTYDFKRWSLESSREKKEGPTRELGPQHPENLFTLGEFGDPNNKAENQDMSRWGAVVDLRSDYLYRDVEAKMLHVRVTSPTPILTPFDYLLFKCKDLMTEILLFISRFDEYFLFTAPFTSWRNDVSNDASRGPIFTTYWYEGVKFPTPIDSGAAHHCIKKLFAYVQLLETHMPREKESAEAGWERRRRIIAGIVADIGPPGRIRNTRADLSYRLNFLASDLNYTAYRPNQDPDLAYLTNEYLFTLADDIQKTACRIYSHMWNDRNSAASFQYRYMGSKDV